jgi:2-octaprenyl-6-methoxyphenol hydroxylase
VQVVGRRWTYPLSAMLADRYIAPRLALVGDAAHGIHPIAGQGLNLGFRDVGALADLLVAAARDGRDPGDPGLLRAYQAARRPANLAMLMATDCLDRLFSSANPALTLARRAGIAATDRMDGAKRVFMRAATGLLDRAAA